MFFRRYLAFAALAASALAPMTAMASTGAADHAACFLSGYHVTGVQPYRVSKQFGRGAVQQLKGAQVFVQAQPGLTAEWLQLQLSQHVAQMRGSDMPDCALDLNGVKVSVDSAGTGFRVKLIAHDGDQAKEVLRRARLLAR